VGGFIKHDFDSDYIDEKRIRDINES
jgi:hypothetical protein